MQVMTYRMSSFLRFTKRLFRPRRLLAQDELFALHKQSYLSAVDVVRVFYVVGLFWAAHIASIGWPEWVKREEIEPLWPLFWANSFDLPTVTNLIMVLLIVTSLPALVQPWRRTFRVFYFVGFFFCIAYINSFGKIGHGFHAWLFVAFIFCFLPKWVRKEGNLEQDSITHRQQFLTILFAAQAAVLLFYSMSGVWKVYAAIDQFMAGQLHAFHPNALAYLIADKLVQTNSWTPLGPFLIKYPLLGWPLHTAAIYFELFSLVVVSRPALHRFWGTMLVLFHFGTILLLFVGFTPNMLLLGLLFIMSPFAPKNSSLSDILTNLPLFGDLWRSIRKRLEA